MVPLLVATSYVTVMRSSSMSANAVIVPPFLSVCIAPRTVGPLSSSVSQVTPRTLSGAGSVSPALMVGRAASLAKLSVATALRQAAMARSGDSSSFATLSTASNQWLLRIFLGFPAAIAVLPEPARIETPKAAPVSPRRKALRLGPDSGPRFASPLSWRSLPMDFRTPQLPAVPRFRINANPIAGPVRTVVTGAGQLDQGRLPRRCRPKRLGPPPDHFRGARFMTSSFPPLAAAASSAILLHVMHPASKPSISRFAATCFVMYPPYSRPRVSGIPGP